MDPRNPDDDGYVARFGFDARTVLVLIGIVVFLIGIIWVPIGPSSRFPIAMQYALKIVGIPVVLAHALWLAINAAHGGVALRVDQHGITLGAPRLRQIGSSGSPLRCSWDQVTEIVLFHRHGGRVRPTFISLRLRSDAQATATTFDTDSQRSNMSHRWAAQVPEDVLMRSRGIIGWRLDREHLREAVARYAPHVQIVRLDKRDHWQRI
jgi:hypothetical protein